MLPMMDDNNSDNNLDDDNPLDTYDSAAYDSVKRILRRHDLEKHHTITYNIVCPKCANQMVRRFEDGCLLTYPWELKWYWWCMCGYALTGGFMNGEDETKIAEEEWRRLNGKSIPDWLDKSAAECLADFRPRTRKRSLR